MWAVQEREASLALVAVLGEKEKVAPALAEGGQCVWAVQECEASLAVEAGFGENEKGAPALTMGAVRVGGAGT